MKVFNFAKLVTIVLMSSALIFGTSCEKDDAFDADLIIGEWTAEEISMEMTIDGVSYADYLVDELGFSLIIAEALLEEMSAEMEISGSVEFNEDSTYTSYMDENEPESGIWNLEDEVLTITFEGVEEEAVFDVVTLSATKLTVEQSTTMMADMNEDETEEEVVTTTKIVFVK
jgi:hypothetical protein